MKHIVLYSFFFLLSFASKAQTYVETTFYAYKDSHFVNNNKRSLFDSEDTYDKKNRLVEKKYLGAVTKGARVTYKYNNKDQKIEEKYYDSVGKVRNVKLFVYNDNGKVKEVNLEWTDKAGPPRSSKEEYFYDDKNELVRKTYTTSKNGLESEWFFENVLVDGHKIIKTKHTLNGKEQKPNEVEYNEKDLVIKEGTLTYTYEYEEGGDWKVKRMYRKGEIVGEYRRVRRKK
jgi:hypothetical protein